MKQIKFFSFLLALSAVFLFSCERDRETEGISRITSFPDFDLTANSGSEIMVVVAGTSGFTVPDPVVTAGGATLPFTTSVRGAEYINPAASTPADVNYTSSFDINKPGMYTFTYSAVNVDGFTGSAERIVFVLDKAPDPTVDLSGAYTSGTSPEAAITKIADGVWYSTNVWGGGSTVKIGAYIMSPDGIAIQVPQQESLVRIYGYGTRDPLTGTMNTKMSRPTFATPLFNQTKVWVRK